MSVKEKFVLKWADYSTTVTAALQELRNMEELFDITLAVENKQILAHKLVLAASSSFFRNVIKNNPHQHPLLYLKGVKYSSLVSILNFMYHGQVSVAQDELTSFLNVAEELNVRGLTNNQSTESKYESDRDSQSSQRKDKANDKVVDLDSDDNDNDDDDKDEIKVSKVVNPKKRTHNYDNIMSQSPAKRAMMTKSTSERLVTQEKMRPTSSQSTSAPRTIKKEKKNDDEIPYIPSNSRKASVDYDNEEDFDDSNSGVNGIRRSKRKSKKRIFPDAVADLKDFSDNEADKIPGRLIQRPRPVDNDSDASDIDNLLENDTNDDTTSDNEKQDESIEIDVEESTTVIKKEIKKEKRERVRKEDLPVLPVLADKGFHDATYHKSTSEPEQESDDPDREIIATLNEALDDLTKDYIVQVPSKDWKCLSCLKLFYAKQSCQNHVEAEHLVSPGHVCPTCYKSFPTIKAVKDHVIAGHKIKEKRNDGDNDDKNDKNDDDDNEIQCEQDIPLIKL